MSNQVLTSKVTAIAAAFLAAVLGVGAAAAQERPLKIAVVNLEFVAANAPAGKELQAKLEKFQQDVRAEVQAKQEAANGIRQRIADGTNTLSDDKLAELQQDYEDAMIAIRRLQDDKQREGQKMQQEGLKAIEQQLEPIFQKIRDEEGYDLILNNVPGMVVMASERVEITRKVVERLQAATPADPGAGG